MFGAGGADHQLAKTVVDHVDRWRPKKKYRSETKFQNDLQEWLDTQLNESQSGGMLGGGLGMGGQEPIPVRREYGRANADVAVGDDIGIELKRKFSNSQKKKLRGQIEEYLDEFPFVIAVACGISDMDGWRDLQNKYQQQGMGLGMGQSGQVWFVHKREGRFGEDPGDSGAGGFF